MRSFSKIIVESKSGSELQARTDSYTGGTMKNAKHILITSGCTALLAFVLCSRMSTPAEPPRYTCAWNGIDTVSFFDSISCPEEFEVLAGPPLMQTLSNERSVKVVYEIATGRTYFISSSVYPIHYDFCREVLGYPRSHTEFNDEQYTGSSLRLYYLATVSYFRDSDVFTLQFFADDRVEAAGIAVTYAAVSGLTCFGGELKFLASSTSLAEKAAQVPGLPVITNDELYGEQNFQALNVAETYGYLRRVSIDDVESSHFGRHDIPVVNGVPISMPVVAGIVTTAFQTPLSHINVLSHNRGTPNMALKNAWSDSTFTKLWDKLVYFVVRADTFLLLQAEIDSAEAYWKSREPQLGITLSCDDSTSGVYTLDELVFSSARMVGAKAANVAVLSRIAVDDGVLPVPEGGFAIPFYYYRRHMKSSGAAALLEKLLADQSFQTDIGYRDRMLGNLREKITDAPLDADLAEMVFDTIRALGDFREIRFRSSTNVEDIEGFNGAGLYDSYTAKLDDGIEAVEDAVRKVYASLWTLRGFEERDYFRIDHTTCAMGILVHRAFPDEQANGVAVTANIFQPYVPAFTINVQIMGISVVRPPTGFRSDQLLVYTLWPDWLEQPSIEYLTYSNVNFGEPVLSRDEVLQLAGCLNRIKNTFLILYDVWDEYRFGMDVEFKFDGPDRKLYIKQARPYTVADR